MSKRLNIGYFNQTLNFEWSCIPWTGVVKEARSRDINLFSFHGNSIADREGFNGQGNAIYDLAKGGRLDGLITWKGHISDNISDDEFLSFCRSYSLPTVTIEGAAHGYPCVTYGNYEGMYMAIEHLIKAHGHKRIGFMGIIPEHGGFSERYRAYKECMRDHGLPINPLFVRPWVQWQGSFEGKPVDGVLDAWLKEALKGGMESIAGVCDPVSLWIIERMEKIGRRVPQALAVVGYDGFPNSRVSTPPLTTIDPSWEMLGAIALSTILDMIGGKTPPAVNSIPARVVLAQSCGCVESNVIAAGSDIRLPGNRDDAAQRIAGATGHGLGDAGAEKARALVDSFYSDAGGPGRNGFLKALDDALRDAMIEGRSIMAWQDAISILSGCIPSGFLHPRIARRANSLCQQARVFICNASDRARASEIIDGNSWAERERALGLRIVSTFDMGQLMDLLADSLPGLDIPACWISLYEDPRSYRYPDGVPEWSTLMLAYGKGGRVQLPPEGRRFRSRELVPSDLWPKAENGAQGRNFIVNALYFRDSQIGFAVFEADLMKGATYGVLSAQISAGLQGTLLIRQIARHSKALEAGISSLSASSEELYRSMENISSSVIKQGGAVDEEASSIEELYQNISRITEMSNVSLAISRTLDGAASGGITSVKRLISSIQSINQKSNNILELVNFIQQVADQTKLLAFNASVEAAHFGEKGKGFNVIANEIRKLAEDTDKSVKNIETVIGDLIALISESAAVSQSTGAGLDIIVGNSRQNSDTSTQLNLAMIEQGKGVTEILKATHELRNITVEIKVAVSEQTAVMEGLKDSLVKLRDDSAEGTAVGRN